MTKFSDIGLRFPLYDGAIDLCPEYEGEGVSVFDGKEHEHSFKLGIGCCLAIECSNCKTFNYLDCGDLEVDCKNCKYSLIKLVKDEIIVSYDDIRSRRAMITKDTEVGMISWEQLQSGYAQGSPVKDGLEDYECRISVDGWHQPKIENGIMSELLATPTYTTWQGERWMFHKKKPMIYIGEWTEEDFENNRHGVTLKEFYEMVLGHEFSRLFEYRNNVNKYIFRSDDGVVLKGHYDFD